MSGRIVILDYDLLTADELRVLADIGIRDMLVEDIPLWERLEPSQGQYDWNWLDRYVENAQKVGIKPILRPNGIPRWVPDQWLTRQQDAETSMRMMISPWSAKGCAALKAVITAIRQRWGDAVTVSPPQPLSENFGATYSYFDDDALADFGMWRQRRGQPASRPCPHLPVYASDESEKRSNLMADTMAWLYESYAAHWCDLYLCEAVATQAESWIGYAPWLWTDTEDIVGKAAFGAEEWVNNLANTVTLNIIFYAYFWHRDVDELGVPSLVMLYLMRKYGWKNVYVGAEGPQNIVRNSERAKALGFAGMVCASPWGNWDGAHEYPAIEPKEAVLEIGKAVEMWHQ
jgi:hypothetical protein